MKTRLLSQQHFRQMPWANGGGMTTELLARTDPASGRMLFRISMAGVNNDGPFSHFAGYDRVLVLTKGRGLRLSLDDGTSHFLAETYDAATFAGDVASHAVLEDGPVQDFNVFVDRDRCRAEVAVVLNGDDPVIRVEADVLTIYAVNHEAQVTGPAGYTRCLPQGELLLIDDPPVGNWITTGEAVITTQLILT